MRDFARNNRGRNKSRPAWTAWAARALGAVLAAFLVFHGQAALAQGQGKPGGPGAGPMPVAAVAAQAKDVRVFLSALGSVTAMKSVTVKSRVDGELMEVAFQEGQMVAQGSLLARIDPRPFEVALSQAQGQLARDTALLENARLDLQRYSELWEQNSVPRQQLDTQQALVRQYEGVVKLDQAQVDNAKLQLTYSRITAPMSGRAGLRLVDPGNLVRSSDATGLVVINQTQPIAVTFSLAEDHLPQILAKQKGNARLHVEIYDRAQARKLAEGQVITLDNQIDASTGTIKIKAEVANKNGELFPNQFVNVRLLLEVQRQALVAPAAAIQRGPQGAFVYVVQADQTAQMRGVSLGQVAEGEAVISQGLSAGDLVVVDGADRLRDGAKVMIKNQPGQPGQPREKK